MTKKKTMTEKLQTKNKKVNQKHKQDLAKTAALHAEVREGKKTAGQAPKERAGKTQTEKIQEQNSKVNKAKKSQPISTRSAEVIVEYDFKKDGEIERRQKHFKDTKEAKSFYADKDKMGRKPKVLSTNKKENTLEEWTRVILDKQGVAERKPKSLAEAFLLDPVDPNNKQPKLIPAGDPTVTTFEQEEKDKAKKGRKKLKRAQKKGNLLWKTKDTLTVVGAVYERRNFFHPCWFLKFNDGTEKAVHHLTIVYSRQHPDHHLRVHPDENYIDGLDNKVFERVLIEYQQFHQQQANRYMQSLRNFKGSDAVQKEMEKRVSKKAAKGDTPLTPQQVELAMKLAELANFYCCSVSYFFMLPEQLKKHPHATLTGDQVVELFDKHGINEGDCTIHVIQQAKRILGRMVARLVVGGPQIGTPELLKEWEAKRAEEMKTVRKADRTAEREAKKATKEAEKAAAKQAKLEARTAKASDPKVAAKIRTVKVSADVDSFGNRVTTGCHLINTEILAAKSGTLFDSDAVKRIDKKCGTSNAGSHFRTLSLKGFLVKTEQGYKMTPSAKTAVKRETAVSKGPAVTSKKGHKQASARKGK